MLPVRCTAASCHLLKVTNFELFGMRYERRARREVMTG